MFALDTLIIYYVLTETIGIRRRSASLCLQQMREGEARYMDLLLMRKDKL